MLVQNNPAVKAICPVGGFLVELPKNQHLPTWSYLVVSSQPETTLTGVRGMACMRYQTDAYAYNAKDVVVLDEAIDRALEGFSGPLPDPDHTVVHIILPSDHMGTWFDAASRTYRRMSEFEVIYFQPE